MPINADDLLESARQLLKNNDEVSFRNAARTAYYAAYHTALAFSEDLDDIPVDGMGSHTALINKFLGSTSFKVKGIGYKLRQCLAIRHEADYKLDAEFGVEKAETVILQAGRIIGDISEIS